MAGAVKRSYDATRRAAASRATRRHVIEAATPLFVGQGYEQTSMRQLADAGGVSLQTLYNAFGSKFGLFSAVVDRIIAGDDEPVALAERPELQALHEVDDARELVARFVAAALEVLRRLSAIYPTLRAAAVSDPQVAEAHQRFTFDARRRDTALVGRRLAELGVLPPGVDAERATDVVWTLLSPDVYDLLVNHRGWSTDDLERWATATLTTTLIAPTSA